MPRPVLSLGKCVKSSRTREAKLAEIRREREEIEKKYYRGNNVKQWRRNVRQRFKQGAIRYASHQMKLDIKRYVALGKEEEKLASRT